jgi:hypothetical protein
MIRRNVDVDTGSFLIFADLVTKKENYTNSYFVKPSNLHFDFASHYYTQPSSFSLNYEFVIEGQNEILYILRYKKSLDRHF